MRGPCRDGAAKFGEGQVRRSHTPQAIFGGWHVTPTGAQLARKRYSLLLRPPKASRIRETIMRILTITAALLATSIFAAQPAAAHSVPPFKGNDTGGIISYHSYPPEVIRDMAVAHCASWGKTTRLTGTQAYYGGYVSFACIWRPSAVRGVVSVKY